MEFFFILLTCNLTECDSSYVFYVENKILLKNINTKVLIPKTNPYLDNGIEETSWFFHDIEFDKNIANNLVFRTHIAFIVDCEGNTSDYKILNNQTNEIYKLELKILDKFKYYTIKWKPATFKNKKVPCYQVLSFTVLNGNITNIFYK